jgi:hypothetical protein
MRKLENPFNPLNFWFFNSLIIVIISSILVGVKNIEAQNL